MIFRAAFATRLARSSLPRQSCFAEGGPALCRFLPFEKKEVRDSGKFAVGAKVVRLRGVSRTDEDGAVRIPAGRLVHLDGAAP